jgi:hypothetical protein
VTIYLSHRSADFRKELYYRPLEEIKEGNSWRLALSKWVRIMQSHTAECDYIRIAAVDEIKQDVVACVDIANRAIISEQIPERKDLFE